MADLGSAFCPVSWLTPTRLRDNLPDVLLLIAVLKRVPLAVPGNRRV